MTLTEILSELPLLSNADLAEIQAKVDELASAALKNAPAADSMPDRGHASGEIEDQPRQ